MHQTNFITRIGGRRRAVNIALATALVVSASLAYDGQGATPEEMLKQAQQLEQAGTVQRAADLYKQFLAAHPDHSQAPEVHYRLGKCHDSLGMVDEAIAELTLATAADQKQFRNLPDALFMLGKLQASVKNHDAAIVALEKLLSIGAGLYEDEALNLCGGYYGIQGKYTEAAAKFNILKNKTGSPMAEQAAHKIALLWLKAGRLDSAVEAIQDFANRHPRNDQIPDLLLRAADAFRQQKKYDQTIALCEQLKSRYPKSNEAVAAVYLTGLCLRERKEFQKAADTLDGLSKATDPAVRIIAADALLQAATIYAVDLGAMDKAIPRYEEAAKLARDAGGDRQQSILEQCHFHIAEYHFRQSNWSVALEHYVLLRRIGSQLNVLGRILKCQAELDAANVGKQFTDADLKSLEEKILANPGTLAAAEAEVFLLDRKLANAVRQKGAAVKFAPDYEAMLKKYPREVLATQSLESYILAQAGYAWSHGETKEELLKAVAAYEKAIAADPRHENPYKVTSLESLALAAERAGDKPRAMAAYKELFALTVGRIDTAKPDPKEQQKGLDYLKSLVTRSDTADLVKDSLALCNQIIEKHGQLSDLSREARYGIAELHYVNKNFSAAAAAFDDFIRIYGPTQNAEGDFEKGPLNADKPEATTEQILEASLRRAHCWFMQGHHQNMIKAYQWIVRNTGASNPRVAEAHYWIALEGTKGEKGKDPDTKRKTAESLWKTVVHPSLDFDDGGFRKKFHPWVGNNATAAARSAEKYVKHAILRSGQLYAEAGQHEIAARVLEQFGVLYPLRRAEGSTAGKKRRGDVEYDELFDMALYSLGRAYAALGNAGKLVPCYQPYLDQLTESSYRVSALKLLGYHAGQDGRYDAAIEAYAALLDEYGVNQKDDKGNDVPVRRELWLRNSRTWDGIRLAVPKDLDQGEIRFALGYLYWKQEQWTACIKALMPFMQESELAGNKSRDKALYMLGRSWFNLRDYKQAVPVMQKLVNDHPKFEAVEEVHVYLGESLVEMTAWADYDALYRRFIAGWPRSDKRHRMDLYAALSLIGQNQVDKGVANLKGLLSGDTFEDVKADAAYHLGMRALAAKPPDHKAALGYFEKSVAIYPRAAACLEAARCQIALKQWENARQSLDRVGREFPKSDSRIVEQAKRLMPDVLKELAKQQPN